MVDSSGPELIFGLVTPVGTNTSELAENLRGYLSDFGYTAVVLKLSDALPGNSKPVGEPEDHRIARLIREGDDFCRSQSTAERPGGDPAAIAKLGVRQIRRTRLALLRQDGDQSPARRIMGGRARTAYILHSLKRPAEVQLLRRIYGSQFVLIGSQDSLAQREMNLLGRALSASARADRLTIVRRLIDRDANEIGVDIVGQRVNETYPLADFFLRDNEVNRSINLLFGDPIAPEVAEFAMYVARASSARSLAASRKVGAAIVVGDSVVATGFNDVPFGQVPDVLRGTDTSEEFKRRNVEDTMLRLSRANLINGIDDSADEQSALPEVLLDRAVTALKGGELMGVIEYQRAVHAEAKAIDDATVRGVSPVGGTLFVTTYPCHLCYKHALSARLGRIEYIEPYPKSRAVSMYPDDSDARLVPYAGVAPRRFMQVFHDRPAFLSDADGRFSPINRSVAVPLLNDLRDASDIDAEERVAINELQEEYR